jgi:hypothetical protein
MTPQLTCPGLGLGHSLWVDPFSFPPPCSRGDGCAGCGRDGAGDSGDAPARAWGATASVVVTSAHDKTPAMARRCSGRASAPTIDRIPSRIAAPCPRPCPAAVLLDPQCRAHVHVYAFGRAASLPQTGEFGGISHPATAHRRATAALLPSVGHDKPGPTPDPHLRGCKHRSAGHGPSSCTPRAIANHFDGLWPAV